MQEIKIALADDHHLVREGFVELINGFDNCRVIAEVSNGKELSYSINKTTLPDIVLVDIKMPEWDGYKTVKWLKETYPDIKVIALSMYEDDISIIKMLHLDIKGYIPKGIRKDELKKAIYAVSNGECYFSGTIFKKIVSTTRRNNTNYVKDFSPQLVRFLELCCTGLTYKEIAKKMNRSEDTIDKYRDKLFVLFNARNRTELVIYAIKNNLITIENISELET